MGNILWGVIAALMAIWFVGFAFDLIGSLIHIALVVALVLVVVNLLSGRRRV